MAFDAAPPQPARQPEAIVAGLIGHANPRDRVTCSGGFIAPSGRNPSSASGSGDSFLISSRSIPGTIPDQPTRSAQFDCRNQRAMLIEGAKGPAEVIKPRHEALHWRGVTHTDGAIPSPLAL
jgi:hypothetical protein